MFINQVKKMSVSLKQLLEDISVAITNANQIMEMNGRENYITQGYQKNADTEETDTYTPLTFDVKMSEEGKLVKVPVTALMHNSTMRLEQVDIKLKFHLEEKDGELMATCTKNSASDDSLNEMSLQYRNSPTPEGVARINNHQIQQI